MNSVFSPAQNAAKFYENNFLHGIWTKMGKTPYLSSRPTCRLHDINSENIKSTILKKLLHDNLSLGLGLGLGLGMGLGLSLIHI